jgi:hypothetical protein
MNTTLKILLFIIILPFYISVFAGQYDVPEGMYNVSVSDAELSSIQNLFPEDGGIEPAFINSTTDPNLHFTDTGDLSVTYIDEGAGYKNSFGYFTFDDNNNILSKHTIFENASGLNKGGVLVAGDTMDLGTFNEGDNVGFWLQANGYWNPDGHTYYTVDELNPDGLRHIAIVDDNGYINIGIEDLYNLGDQDYNDIIFRMNITPNSAIDKANIPGNPAPPPLVTALLSLFTLTVIFLKKKVSSRKTMR